MAVRTSVGGGASGTPIYNIAAAARLTGVPAATLRVWERRYGFPDAVRSEGGQRIYSDADIRRIRWVKERVDEGMQVGLAVRALQALVDQGRDPGPASAPPPRRDEPGATLDVFHRRLTAALLEHDTQAAAEILGDALALYPLDDLLVGVARPSLVDVGDGWSRGRVLVATEHLATQFLRQRMAVWLAGGPAPRDVAPIAMACAPDEWHDTGLLLLAVLLRRRGWPVDFLGQAQPLADLAAYAASTEPSAVVISATRPETAAALVDWPKAMPVLAAAGAPPVCFGGRAFVLDPQLRDAVPGVYLGDTLTDGVERLEAVLAGRTS